MMCDDMKSWKGAVEQLADHLHRAHAEMLRAAIDSAECAMNDPSEENASRAFVGMALAKIRYTAKLKSFSAQLEHGLHAPKTAPRS